MKQKLPAEGVWNVESLGCQQSWHQSWK